MATLNYGAKELVCKIVYYGPAYGGKTTNLQQIHSKLPSGSRGKLTSLNTRQDRTLFFDLLPVDMGKIGDYFVKVQLYTVPGQVEYDATRRVVLSGVDGVVVVFDSDPEREQANYMSLANLEENLGTYGLKVEETPTVFQFNKRDLAQKMPTKFMSASLNPDGLFPEIEAVAVQGKGVQETMRKICSLVFERLERDIADKEMSSTASRRRSSTAGASAPKAPVVTDTARLNLAAISEELQKKVDRSPLRISQFCDLRFKGVRIGHGSVKLLQEDSGSEEPWFTATVTLHPALGAARCETIRLWRTGSLEQEDSPLEVLESRDAEKSFKVLVERGEDRPTRLFAIGQARLGEVILTPEGENRAPEWKSAPEGADGELESPAMQSESRQDHRSGSGPEN